MGVNFDSGLHAAPGRAVDASAYEQYIGRWSRLFIPALLAAAKVASGHRVLDVAAGSGEAAAMALSAVERPGTVVGTDISEAMLRAASVRLQGASFRPVVMDGHALALRDRSFDAVVCQLGLQFFSDPVRGVKEFRRVLRPGRWAAVCVISTPERAPMWGVLADTLSRHLPEQRAALHLSFALADTARLEHLFRAANFRDVRVERELRQEWSSPSTTTGGLSKPEPGRFHKPTSRCPSAVDVQYAKRSVLDCRSSSPMDDSS